VLLLRNNLEWTSFWETFNAAIHTSNITAVQKFDYLKEYLKGEARLIVENLKLSNTNYQFAIDELKRTYGKTGSLIEAHMEKLLELEQKECKQFSQRLLYLNRYDETFHVVELLN
jgi:hypothetical protein